VAETATWKAWNTAYSSNRHSQARAAAAPAELRRRGGSAIH
jgi:hypothetical protein